MDEKIVNPQAAAHMHGGCGHAFHDVPPRDFSPRNGSTHYAPPAHVADVRFMRLRMRLSIQKSPPILLSYIRAFRLVYGVSAI